MKPSTRLVIFFAGFLLVSGIAAAGWLSRPLTLDRLLKLPPERLAKVDIAEMNLLCASGLPGAKKLDIPASLKTLDEWALHVKEDTARNLHQYYDTPARFHNMEGFYRMMLLVTDVQLDFGCHYDEESPDDQPASVFFRNSDHLFIHGLIGERRAGSCASIPVLVTAIARRLGYPVKLVATRTHSFARWDDGHDRFNIEATNQGMASHSDDYYRQWPKPVTDQQIAEESYLRSMTAQEELACFLLTRAACLETNGRVEERRRICQKGLELIPSSRLFRLNQGDKL